MKRNDAQIGSAQQKVDIKIGTAQPIFFVFTTFKIEVQSQEGDEEEFRQGERIPGA